MGTYEGAEHMKAQTAKTNTGSGSSVARRRRAGRDHVATFRNSRGETLEPSSVTASEAKSEFGRVLETKLDALNHQFDALLAQMQTPKARRGMKTAFAASAKQLGKAAVAAARSRG